MQQAIVLAAKETLGTSGGCIRPLIPRHSEAFRKTAAHIRLLRVMCRKLLSRRIAPHPLPASTAMAKLWHLCPEAYPEGSAFRDLNNQTGEGSWSRLAVGGLRARIHATEEELRLLRRTEEAEVSEQQRKAVLQISLMMIVHNVLPVALWQCKMLKYL